MPNPIGFKQYSRETPQYRPPEERVKDFKEIYRDFPLEKTRQQAERCMDCGVPFCHNGCPLGNVIPEFNDAVQQNDWKTAFDILSSTNNFPEFTGRICPAPCESACVLGINQPAVAIEHIEKSIAEIAFEQGYVRAKTPSVRTGKKVAVVGSGPAGLAAAAQLNKAGHFVTVFEKSDKIGGLLQYGIPDFKLEKWVVERRVKLMMEEGVVFKTNHNVGGCDLQGKAVTVQDIAKEFDAVLICIGSTVPRDLPLEGRNLKGVHFAMDYLEQNNRRVAGEKILGTGIHARNKHVVVIGGGDTGSDCIGTANRHGAKSITQLDYHLKPTPERPNNAPWPLYPMVLRESSSHEEGCDRQFAVLSNRFVGENGVLTGVEIVDLEWRWDEAQGKNTFQKMEGSNRVIPADLVFIAIGFQHPMHEGLVRQWGLKTTQRGTIDAQDYATNIDKIFVAGDARMGQSLVVNAISEGREAARAIDVYLTGQSILEGKEHSFLIVEY